MFLFATVAGWISVAAFLIVSIPGGICSSLRPRKPIEGRWGWHVSIPGGICSSLRPNRPQAGLCVLCSFNPRRDLFLFATPLSSRFSGRPCRFQSQAGFVPLCDVPLARCPYAFFWFQSQAGFVPLCDTDVSFLIFSWQGVSIPGGICSSLRR